MTADNFRTPTVIFPDRLSRSSFVGDGNNRHRFGGPLELEIKNWLREHPLPNRVMTLNLADPLFGLGYRHMNPVPLIYAFQISGCLLRYQVDRRGAVEVRDCKGQLENDWPYANYPVMFPTAPLYFNVPEPIDWQALEQDEDWHGLTNQDSRPKANEALVVVPANDAYGVSLWGWSGDRDGVQVVFRVNLESLLIDAWNEST